MCKEKKYVFLCEPDSRFQKIFNIFLEKAFCVVSSSETGTGLFVQISHTDHCDALFINIDSKDIKRNISDLILTFNNKFPNARIYILYKDIDIEKFNNLKKNPGVISHIKFSGLEIPNQIFYSYWEAIDLIESKKGK